MPQLGIGPQRDRSSGFAGTAGVAPAMTARREKRIKSQQSQNVRTFGALRATKRL